MAAPPVPISREHIEVCTKPKGSWQPVAVWSLPGLAEAFTNYALEPILPKVGCCVEVRFVFALS